MDDNEYIEKNDSGKIPDQKELEKELSDYLSKKYGNRIKIISPLLYPQGQNMATDDGKEGEESSGLPYCRCCGRHTGGGYTGNLCYAHFY